MRNSKLFAASAFVSLTIANPQNSYGGGSWGSSSDSMAEAAAATTTMMGDGSWGSWTTPMMAEAAAATTATTKSPMKGDGIFSNPTTTMMGESWWSSTTTAMTESETMTTVSTTVINFGSGWPSAVTTQAESMTKSCTESVTWPDEVTAAAASTTSHSTSAMWTETTPAMWTETTSAMWTQTTSAAMWTETTSATMCSSTCFSPPMSSMSWSDSSSWGSSSWGSMGSSAPPMIQVVQVGSPAGALSYWPEKIVAAPGSIVQFQFNPKNHTVSESSFSSPCQPITLTSPQTLSESHPGVFSGYVPVSNEVISNTTFSLVETIAVFNVLINSTAPTWIYCSQGDHCASGMAMVINEPDMICGSPANTTGKTLEAYKAAAAMMMGMNSSYGGGSSWGSSSSSWGWGSSSTRTTTATETVMPTSASMMPTWASMMTTSTSMMPMPPMPPPASAPPMPAMTTSPAGAPPPSPSIFEPDTSPTKSSLPAGISVFTGAAAGRVGARWEGALLAGLGMMVAF